MSESQRMQKRELKNAGEKGISIKELILIGVLLAAGAVLKYLIGSLINIAGAKPNFIIAMYCLGILLIRPKVYEAAIIGLIAGGVCQFLPGTVPWLNFISEFAGAIVMSLIIRVPMKAGKMDMNPVISTFISTVISGGLFVAALIITGRGAQKSLVAFIPLVLITALINSIIVGLLHIPLKNAFKTGLR